MDGASTVDILQLDDDAGANNAESCYAEEEADAAEVDFDLPAGEVVSRVEQLVAGAIEELCAGKLPTLGCYAANTSTDDAVDGVSGYCTGVQFGQRRDMLQNQGQSALGITRVFQVLQVVHEMLRNGLQATQRDIYYKLLNPPIFASDKDVNAAIRDAAAALRVPRSSLGITCATRGAVAGKLYIRDSPGQPWQDCTGLASSGKSIAGDLGAIERMGMQCTARYILVIEKDAIFQRLCEDRLFDKLPCVLITAKGFPDVATRVFLQKLSGLFPSVLVLGFVDWNPAGVTILRTYKYGSCRSVMESRRYSVPSLRWLGMRASMLEELERSAFHQLTKRDLALLPNLHTSLQQHPEWLFELRQMEEAGLKADIEALYNLKGFQGLSEVIISHVLRQDYV